MLGDLKDDIKNENLQENNSSKTNQKYNSLQSEIHMLEQELSTLKLKYEHDVKELNKNQCSFLNES